MTKDGTQRQGTHPLNFTVLRLGGNYDIGFYETYRAALLFWRSVNYPFISGLGVPIIRGWRREGAVAADKALRV